MRLMITGSNGFLATNIIKLLKSDFELVLVARNISKASLDVPFYQKEVSSSTFLSEGSF